MDCETSNRWSRDLRGRCPIDRSRLSVSPAGPSRLRDNLSRLRLTLIPRRWMRGSSPRMHNFTYQQSWKELWFLRFHALLLFDARVVDDSRPLLDIRGHA